MRTGEGRECASASRKNPVAEQGWLAAQMGEADSLRHLETPMPGLALILRRATFSRKGGPWSEHDYDVFDGKQNVGRIYGVGGRPDGEWFWGVSFQLTGKKDYSRAPSLDEAKMRFRADYLAWKAERGPPIVASRRD